MKNTIAGLSIFAALAATGCMGASSGSAVEAIVVCEGYAEDGAACMVDPGADVCASAENAQGNLCECVPVDGSRTGAWDCFPAEPVEITCRDVVAGALCTDEVQRCVNAYEGFDVVCDCYAEPGTRRALTWRCEVVPSEDCASLAGCTSAEPGGPASDCPEGADCAPTSPGDCPEGADCGPVMVGCDTPGGCPDPGPADDCPPGADCGPSMGCDTPGGCPDPGPADDCPPGADCGPSMGCATPGGCTDPATCMERESALRRCEQDYETCLSGPPSFISCEDQRDRCIDAAPSCAETR